LVEALQPQRHILPLARSGYGAVPRSGWGVRPFPVYPFALIDRIDPSASPVIQRIKYYDRIIDYIRQFEGVVLMTGREILDWYNSASVGN
jgi:hypothetical protein